MPLLITYLFWNSSQLAISLTQPHLLPPSSHYSLPLSRFVCPFTSLPDSAGASQCAESSADVLVSSAVVPLSMSRALSPEEFERLWLWRQGLHAEQGNEMGS